MCATVVLSRRRPRPRRALSHPIDLHTTRVPVLGAGLLLRTSPERIGLSLPIQGCPRPKVVERVGLESETFWTQTCPVSLQSPCSRVTLGCESRSYVRGSVSVPGPDGLSGPLFEDVSTVTIYGPTHRRYTFLLTSSLKFFYVTYTTDL